MAGVVGAGLQGSMYPPGPGHGTSAGVLVVGIAALLAGLLAAWPHLTGRAWAKGTAMLLVGLVVGGAGGAVVLAVADARFQQAIDAHSSVPLSVLGPLWILVAAVAGAAAGATRSARAAISGFVGGVFGGAIGGTLFWWGVKPAADGTGALVIRGTDPATMGALALTGAFIGLFASIADRVSRRAALKVIEGRLRGRTINLDRAETTLGSGSRCTVVLTGDDAIADQHAQIALSPDEATLTAFSEVKVNGQSVDGSTVVSSGDIIQIGGSFIRFERHGEG
jgi:hypothetical protein